VNDTEFFKQHTYFNDPPGLTVLVLVGVLFMYIRQNILHWHLTCKFWETKIW